MTRAIRYSFQVMRGRVVLFVSGAPPMILGLVGKALAIKDVPSRGPRCPF